MDGLTFQRFLMATFCVICQSVTRGIALEWVTRQTDVLAVHSQSCSASQSDGCRECCRPVARI